MTRRDPILAISISSTVPAAALRAITGSETWAMFVCIAVLTAWGGLAISAYWHN